MSKLSKQMGVERVQVLAKLPPKEPPKPNFHGRTKIRCKYHKPWKLVCEHRFFIHRQRDTEEWGTMVWRRYLEEKGAKQSLEAKQKDRWYSDPKFYRNWRIECEE